MTPQMMNGAWTLFAGINKHFSAASVKNATSINNNARKASPPPKDMPMRSSTSALCTPRDAACRRTTD